VLVTTIDCNAVETLVFKPKMVLEHLEKTTSKEANPPRFHFGPLVDTWQKMAGSEKLH
jgi:hypothetical protein